MDSFFIKGGNDLNGEVVINGSKNVALKILIAALLTEDEVIIKNVPLISDLMTLVDVVRLLGVSVEIKDHTMTVKSRNLTSSEISSREFAKLRASFLLMIPLLVRFGKAKVPVSGGDKIGVRPIDRTLDGLEALGVKVWYLDQNYHASVDNLCGCKYQFNKSTHTGTEAMIMASVFCEGETVLKNAALEPEVDELIRFLNLMGAKIKRTNLGEIVISGVKKLHGTSFSIPFDRNEAVTFAVAGLLTHGVLEISPVIHNQLDSFYSALKKANAVFTKNGSTLIVDGRKKPFFSTSVETGPHPGFMTDWQAPWAVLMTQAEGESLIWEKVYENRFGYVQELLKMGADIKLFDPKCINPDKLYNFNYSDGKGMPHAAKIFGPTKLDGKKLIIPDLRAGATLVLAALCALGESTLLGVNHIDRGYEDFEGRLKKIGAKIERIREV